LFARLAIGVCLLAQSEGALRRKSTKKKERGPSRMGRGPATTEYVLGQKVSVGFNCVDAVKQYVRGDAQSLPAIQWLVRGHWRNQPIGSGRSERKRIWIMPHWKGPQEAPKLFREYEFKPSLAMPPRRRSNMRGTTSNIVDLKRSLERIPLCSRALGTVKDRLNGPRPDRPN
jgi:hypothetical protein